MSKLPDLEGLAIFAKVAQQRSFAGAAAELQLSKATVSKAVARIEAKFGTRLFNRTSRRLSLTEAGRELSGRAGQILADGEAAEDEAIAQSSAPRGRIRLAAPLSYGVLRVAPLMPEFFAAYPDISVDLHLSDTHVDLVGEGYDAAVRIATLPDSSLVARTLLPMPRYLVAAPSYLKARSRPSHPLRIADHKCIGYTSANGVQESWHFTNAAGETAIVRPDGPLRANNGDAMMAPLLAGFGLAILPQFFVEDALNNGRLVRVLPEWTVSAGSVHWVTPGGRRPKRVEVLGEFLAQSLAPRHLSSKPRRSIQRKKR